MKQSKVASTFVTKLSNFLPKLKETSTINVAHEQIRKLFSEYKYSDIAMAFASKMDSCDQLTDKQKKEHSKVYITLMDVYGQDIILEHYQRFIESLAKKTVGVSEVVGQLCKTLLNRIYPVENIGNYIQHLLNNFNKHIETGKIFKQIVESFDPELIEPFQYELMSILSQRTAHCRHSSLATQRCEILSAFMSIILVLEEKFEPSDNIMINTILKLFKSEDYNTRKLCVDIAYSLLVITKEAHTPMHEAIKELKYDKIKFVRDSVNNYNLLYKQLYEGDSNTPQSTGRKTFLPVSFASKNRKEEGMKKHVSKSPQIPKFTHTSDNKSLDKSIKNTRNEDFFDNANNKDVIKAPLKKDNFIGEKKVETKPKGKNAIVPGKVPGAPKITFNMKSPSFADGTSEAKSSEFSNPDNFTLSGKHGEVNFEQYLNKDTRSPARNEKLREDLPHFQYKPVGPLFNPPPQNRVAPQNFSKEQQSTMQQEYPNINSLNHNSSSNYVLSQMAPITSSEQSNTFRENMEDSRVSLAEISTLKDMFVALENRVIAKIDALETKVDRLEKNYIQLSESQFQAQMNKKDLEESFDQKFSTINRNNNNHHENSIGSQSSELNSFRQQDANHIISNLEGIESNLDNKIKESLLINNWDQAFSIALANGKKNILIELLKPCRIPKDRLVIDCLLLELKKNLNNTVVLKWLLSYLQQCHELGHINVDGLQKIWLNLDKMSPVDEESQVVMQPEMNKQKSLRNYRMIKGMVMNEILEVVRQQESIVKANLNQSYNDSWKGEYKPGKHF